MQKTSLFTPKKTMLAASTLALALTLSACSVGADSTDPSELTVIDGWAKASDSMTGVFGTLTNPTDTDLSLVNASSSVAGMVELHETVAAAGSTVMQEIDSGFLIPAGGDYILEPGGDHIMLMDLNREILPGEQLDLTLEYSDGQTVELQIDVRDFSGAVEEYAPGDHDEHAKQDEHADH